MKTSRIHVPLALTVAKKMEKLLPEIQAFIQKLEFSSINSLRKLEIEDIVIFIQQKQKLNEHININFICTHNSRRSQLCHVWAKSAITYYQLNNINAFSGGTEITSFNTRAVQALKSCGLKIKKDNHVTNPVYSFVYSDTYPPINCFSKLYNHPGNSSPFIAVMTCSEAESNCPYIPEAEKIFSLKYQDPKIVDSTSDEEKIYSERNYQIANEMFYLFSLINNKNANSIQKA